MYDQDTDAGHDEPPPPPPSFALPEGYGTYSCLELMFDQYSATKVISSTADSRLVDSPRRDKSYSTIDLSSVSRLAKNAPGLIGGALAAHDIGLVWHKVMKTSESRRFDFFHFLQVLRLMAEKRYPEDDPVTAFAKVVCYHLLGLLTHDDPDTGEEVVFMDETSATLEAIVDELLRPVELESEAELALARPSGGAAPGD